MVTNVLSGITIKKTNSLKELENILQGKLDSGTLDGVILSDRKLNRLNLLIEQKTNDCAVAYVYRQGETKYDARTIILNRRA